MANPATGQKNVLWTMTDVDQEGQHRLIDLFTARIEKTNVLIVSISYGRNGGAGPMRGSVPYGGRGGGGGSGITMGQGGYGSSRGGSDPYPAPMPPSYMRREMAAAADYDSGYGGGGGAYGKWTQMA